MDTPAGGEGELDPEDPKVEAAVFGRDVENFIENDPIGKYLVRRAREVILAMQEELLRADPEDTKLIRHFQTQARVADQVRTWLAEAVRDGRAAEQLIQQERDEHERA